MGGSNKRKLVKQVADIVDSDFETQTIEPIKKPKIIRQKKSVGTVGKSTVSNPVASYPMLLSRSSPACLFDAVSKMNINQRNAVNSMGFGHILGIKIKELPSRLAYWVVDNFDSRSCELMLLNGRRVRVTEEDVHRVLGFPNGQQRMEMLGRYESNDLYEQWKSFFHMVQKGRIVLRIIAEVMLDCTDGGTWFKRHFLILVASSLIQSTKSGNIFPYIMKCLHDVSRVREWNWAEYVLRSLVDSRRKWENSNTKMFVGPSMFLMVFYVDRVIVFNKNVGREFPIFTNWDHKTLKEREDAEIDAGGFGGGYPCDPIVVTKDCLGDLPRQIENSHVDGETHEGEVERNFVGVLLRKIKMAATVSVEIMNMIENAPITEVGNITFSKTIEAAKRVLGCTQIPDAEVPVIPFEDDDFWRNEDVMKSIDEVEAAVKKRSEYIKNFEDMPSFSLGLTQMDNAVLGEIDINDGTFTGVTKNKDRHLLQCGEAYVGCSEMNTNKMMLADGIMHSGKSEKVASNRGFKIKDFNKEPVSVLLDKENAYDTSIKKVYDRKEFDCADKQLVLHTRNSKVNNIVAESETLNCRRKTLMKKPDIFLSPFVQRKLNPSKRLTRSEKQLGMFAMHNLEDEEDEILFAYETIEIRRNDMTSLANGCNVGVVIVNAWAMLLNDLEGYRAKQSPNRFFATTNICLDSIVRPPKNWTYDRRRDIFFNLIAFELTQYQQTALSSVDLFFFPIYQEKKFYAICVDAKNGKVFVIDSLNDNQSECRLEKYDSIILDVQVMLADYLIYRQQNRKGNIVSKSKIVVIKVKWGDSKNTTDTGIYLMRHMETFMGDGSSNWNGGLSIKCDRQLKLLRVRYCAAILGWKHNTKKDDVVMSAEAYFQELSADPNVNIDATLL